MIIKFIVSVAVFTIWMFSGIVIMLGGMFAYHQDSAWGVAVAICLAISYGVWYCGRKLYGRFKLGFQLYWVVAVVMLLFAFIIQPTSPFMEFAAGVISAVIFTVLGFAEYRKNDINNDNNEIVQKTEQTRPDVDPIIPAANRYVQCLENLSKTINDSYVRSQIIYLHMASRQIVDFADSNPQDAHKAAMFKEYYLPKTVKLLEKYATLSQQTIRSENIQSSMDKIADSLENMRKIFGHCLNSLYGDIALDISVDIDVLEQMMNLEGMGSDSAS